MLQTHALIDHSLRRDISVPGDLDLFRHVPPHKDQLPWAIDLLGLRGRELFPRSSGGEV